jgi:hypothetical protein
MSWSIRSVLRWPNLTWARLRLARAILGAFPAEVLDVLRYRGEFHRTEPGRDRLAWVQHFLELDRDYWEDCLVLLVLEDGYVIRAPRVRMFLGRVDRRGNCNYVLIETYPALVSAPLAVVGVVVLSPERYVVYESPIEGGPIELVKGERLVIRTRIDEESALGAGKGCSAS